MAGGPSRLGQVSGRHGPAEPRCQPSSMAASSLGAGGIIAETDAHSRGSSHGVDRVLCGRGWRGSFADGLGRWRPDRRVPESGRRVRPSSRVHGADRWQRRCAPSAGWCRCGDACAAGVVCPRSGGSQVSSRNRRTPRLESQIDVRRAIWSGPDVVLPDGSFVPDFDSPTGHMRAPVQDLRDVALAGQRTREMNESLLARPEPRESASRLGLSGCRPETCVPRQAHGSKFSLTQRSSASRQASSRLPSVSPAPNARFGGYRASVTAKVAVHRGNPG
jgi:hypothetical protein